MTHITIERAKLEQAMEAITTYLSECPDPREEAVEGLCDAASALRKALAAPVQKSVAWEHHAQKLTQWLYCMSYNDSYFGEPTGLVKQVTAELNRLIGAAPPAQPAPVQPLTEARKFDLASNWFAEDWAITKAIGMLHDYDRLLRSDAPPNVATPLAAPVQSLQCFHCQVTIETLNDKVMSLMAQPAERTAVPLTNEQIEEIFQEAAGADEGVVQRFARFIEAAHGITEKGQP